MKRKSLQRTSQLVISVSLVVLFCALLSVVIINMSSMLRANEVETMQQRGNVVTSSINVSTQNLQSITRDYSSWDDTRDFVLGDFPEYPEENIGEYPFLLHSLNIVVIKDLEGNTLFEKFYNFALEEEMQVPDGFTDALNPIAQKMLGNFESQALFGIRDKIGEDGFFIHDDVSYYMTCLPVLDSEESQEPVGTFFFGRIFDAAEIRRLTGTSEMDISVVDISQLDSENAPTFSNKNPRASKTAIQVSTSDNKIHYYELRQNILGEETVVVKLVEVRSLFLRGQDAIIFASILAFFFLFIFSVFLIIVLNKSVMKPLHTLSTSVQNITPKTTSIEMKDYKSQEFYTVGESVNTMLGRLRQSREDLEKSSVSIQVFQNMLNGMDADLYVNDVETNELLFVNEKMKRHFNIKDDVNGKKFEEVFGGNNGKSEHDALEFLRQNPNEVYAWEEYNEALDEYYQNTDSMIPWSSKGMKHMQHSINITDLKLAQRHLEDAKELAEAGNHAKGEFLSRMSHEMRTPMTAIIGMTGIAKKAKEVERKEYCLDKIDNASRHLLGVINDILDMSKIEANKFEISTYPFELTNLLTGVVNVIIFRAEEKGQTLIVDVDPRLPNTLIGDEQRLAQVITNLFSNAIKFTPEQGTIKLEASLVEETEDDCTILMKVIDNGIGITEEQKNKLFSSFEQADGSISRKFGGTGLGLVISKKIIELMDGEIHIESVYGEGSSFVFTIKLEKNKNIEEQEQVVLPPSLRVLLIESNEEVSSHFTKMMTQSGVRVDVVTNAAETLRSLREQTYEIVFMDWESTFYEPSDLLHSINTSSHVPVVILTPTNWNDNEGVSLEQDVLPKPLFVGKILDVMSEILGITERKVIAKKKFEEQKIDLTGKNILVAEDVDLNREILGAIMENSKAQIRFAFNGIEAVEYYKETEKLDLIIMDIQMPEMDGLEATRRIRALEKEKGSGRIPIIAMTANVFKEDIERCVDAGMDDHVGKPIDVKVLFSKIKEYIR